MSGIGYVQRYFLRTMAAQNLTWNSKSEWSWAGHPETVRAMEGLKRRGFLIKSKKGVFRLSKAGKTKVNELCGS